MSPKSKTVILLLLCFVLGGVVGFVAERYYLAVRMGHRPDPAQVRKEFSQKLQLDSLQLERIDSLMDSHRKKMDDLRKLFSLERDTLRMGVRKVLSPEQDQIYEGMIKELDARRHEGDHQPPK